MKLNLKYSPNRFVATQAPKTEDKVKPVPTPAPKTEAKVKAAPKKVAKKTEVADK